MIIYQFRNRINGKCYIGQTIGTLEQRLKGHLSGQRSNSLIYRAFKKYGVENFDKTIVLYANDLSELNYYEKECIRVFKTLAPNGYNLATGGDNSLHHEISKQRISKTRIERGIRHTPETLAIISSKLKGRESTFKGKHHTDETKKKLSENGKLLIHTDESKQKIVSASKSMWANMTEDQKLERAEKISSKLKEAHKRDPKTIWNKGIKTGPQSVETLIKKSAATKRMWENKTPEQRESLRQKLVVANTGKKQSAESIAKMKNTLTGLMAGEKHPFYGKHHTEETKKTISDKLKGQRLTDETKNKISLKLKGFKHSPESTERRKTAWVKRKEAKLLKDNSLSETSIT